MLQVTGRAALRCSPRPRGPCGRRRGRRASPPCQAGGSAPCHPARWAPCGQESTSLCRAAPGDEPASQTRTILRKAEVAPRAAWQLCGLHAGLQGGVGGRWVLWGQDAGAGAGHPCTTGSKGQLPTAPSAESCARKPPRHVRWPSACPHDPGDTHLPVPGVCRRGGPPTCTCIHVRTHAHAHMRTRMCTHIHAQTCAHAHTCTHVQAGAAQALRMRGPPRHGPARRPFQALTRHLLAGVTETSASVVISIMYQLPRELDRSEEPEATAHLGCGQTSSAARAGLHTGDPERELSSAVASGALSSHPRAGTGD